MSNKHNYLGTTDDPQLRLKADVLMLMLKGAGYAFAFCLVLVLIVWFTALVGKLLPDAAREAEDPSPWSYNLTVPEIQYAQV